MKKKIILTGAGTGGHIFTNLHFFYFLKSLKIDFDCVYVCGNQSAEVNLLKKHNIEIKKLKTGKLRRYFSFLNFLDFFKFFIACFKSFFYIKSYKPDFIFSSGGYVAFPVIFAGFLLRIPIFIHEQTSRLGLANKLSSVFARRIYMAFPYSHDIGILKRDQKKLVYTGQTLNKNLWEHFQKEKTSLILKKDRPLIYITGGSQGAHKINQNFIPILKEILKKGYQLVYQYGVSSIHKNDYDEFSYAIQKLPDDLKENIHFFNFLSPQDLLMVYSNAKLIIGRSGALTLSEAIYFSIPAIWIPYPFSGGDEQFFNAEYMKKIGAAEIIEQNYLNSERLLKEIFFLFDSGKIKWMSKNLKSFNKESKGISYIWEDIQKNLLIEKL